MSHHRFHPKLLQSRLDLGLQLIAPGAAGTQNLDPARLLFLLRSAAAAATGLLSLTKQPHNHQLLFPYKKYANRLNRYPTAMIPSVQMEMNSASSLGLMARRSIMSDGSDSVVTAIMKASTVPS